MRQKLLNALGLAILGSLLLLLSGATDGTLNLVGQNTLPELSDVSR